MGLRLTFSVSIIYKRGIVECTRLFIETAGKWKDKISDDACLSFFPPSFNMQSSLIPTAEPQVQAGPSIENPASRLQVDQNFDFQIVIFKVNIQYFPVFIDHKISPPP